MLIEATYTPSTNSGISFPTRLNARFVYEMIYFDVFTALYVKCRDRTSHQSVCDGTEDALGQQIVGHSVKMYQLQRTHGM